MLRLHRKSTLFMAVCIAMLSTTLFAQPASRDRTLQPSALAQTANESLHSQSSVPDQRQQQKRDIEIGYANLPLSFELNLGQTDSQVKFVTRAPNRTVWLTGDGAVISIGQVRRPNLTRVSGPPAETAVLHIKFLGAARTPLVRGESKQPGVINYLVGPESGWRTNIPIYGRVRYRNVYPGIDAVFYGNNQHLEYDLVISSGSDPEQIELAIEGAQRMTVDSDGNLLLETPAGNVLQQKPRIYQRSGKALKQVTGRYVITAASRVKFALGTYDHASPLVIDPVLRYSTFLGGSNIDIGRGVAVDSSNRAVVVGTACSQDFPIKGPGTPPNPGGCSAFITKFDFNGAHLVFSTLLGQNADGNGVALDSSGNIYVTGDVSLSFPTTPGAFQTRFGGDTDAFVAKLKPSGSGLVYSTFLGGTSRDIGLSIALDSAGNAYVTGVTDSTDFPTTAGVFQHDCNQVNGSCNSAFVTKLNATGSQALYSTYLGGHGSQDGDGIDVNSAGNAFVAGGTTASDFPTTAGSAQPVFHGSTDAFVSELSSSGSHLIYSTFLGGSSDDAGAAIALDSFGNAFVTGLTRSSDFPVKAAFQPQCTITNGQCINAFVTKLNGSGRIVYSTYLGGTVTGGEIGTGIAVTPGGQAYVTGFTRSTHFPTTLNAFQRLNGGENDIYITKFSPAGHLIYSSYLGGNGADLSPAIALDRDTNAYLTGIVDFETSTPGHTFPVTPGAFQQTPGGAGDAFLAKVVSLCALSTVNRSVTVCSPASGSSVASPIRIIAGTTDVTPVKLTQVYVDGHKIYEAALSAINVALPLAAGTHRLTVQSFDTANAIFKKSITITVR